MIMPSIEKHVDSFKEMIFARRNGPVALANLVKYCDENGIRKAVVGISGGVDSATVLAMAVIALGEENVIAVADDLHSTPESNYSVGLLMERFPNVVWRPVERVCCMRSSLLLGAPIARHNVEYATRYLEFFAVCQLEIAAGNRCIVLGTINYDERAYIGWFGKHSDMMVDVLPIANLYKFEVRELAYHLGVPESIIKRAPTGEIPSGETDEEVFGVTYDELSYFNYLMSEEADYDELPHYMKEKFKKCQELHLDNIHKYYSNGFGSPIIP